MGTAMVRLARCLANLRDIAISIVVSFEDESIVNSDSGPVKIGYHCIVLFLVSENTKCRASTNNRDASPSGQVTMIVLSSTSHELTIDGP